jgi:hypothetical protein
VKGLNSSNRQKNLRSGAHKTDAAEKPVELIKELMKTTEEEKKNNNSLFYSLRRSNLKERQKHCFIKMGNNPQLYEKFRKLYLVTPYCIFI